MSDSRVLDSESRRIAREELETNLIVEAGAGSGKTQMLAKRMAAGVAAGVYQIDRMAAVTFTRKAGSELRGRFHLALEAERDAASAGSDALTRIDHALSNLERFFAGTIHSFCARLLRERPVESGVSPGFTELDETQDVELRKRVWRDFVTMARSQGDADMMALLAADVKPADLDAAFATVCLHEDVEFPAGDAQPPDPAPALQALEAFWRELAKHLPTQIDPATTCKLQEKALEFRGRYNVAGARLARPSVIASLLSIWNLTSKITQNRWADSTADKKRINSIVVPLHQQFRDSVVTPYLSQWRQYVYRLSVTLLARARGYAALERRRLNTLNYGDLLILTAKVLRENEEVRRSLQQKYCHLFVDEFQDTDPVQAEIAFLLAADERRKGEAGRPGLRPGEVAGQIRQGSPDWRTIPLRPGALFVVGDPKQSIYRFRRADIDIYNIVRSRFSDPAVGRVLPLTMNFRSVPALCTWANGVFGTVFPEEPTTHAPSFAGLDPSRDDEGRSGLLGPGTSGLLTLSHTGNRSDVLQADAERIAAYIRAEVDAGRRRFSDFLILTRKKKGRIAPYAKALEALNIPIEVSGAGAFGESAEVMALVKLLRALADPQDALALVAVLRGPFFGISDPELFAYKQAGGLFSLFADAGANRVSAALSALREYHRWTRVLPAGAALERILENTGYLALAATTPGGVEAGDLLHAVDRVRRVVEEGGSLADAAESLEDDGEESNEVESLPLEPGKTDVVRLMNLHKAKGLEADVVFLADPTGGFGIRIDEHIRRQGEKALGWFKLVKKTENSWSAPVIGEHADWPQCEAAELPYRQAEEHRLLYVAATRAREMLVVSRFAGTDKNPAWGLLNNFLANATELAVPDNVTVSAVVPLDTSNDAEAAFTAGRAATHAVARRPSWTISSATAETRHIARITRSVDATADDPTRVVGTDTPAHRADAGAAWGSLIHGLLEHAMRHPAASREDLRRLAMWLTVEEPQLRVAIDQAIDTVQRVASADFWKQAQAGVHFEEAPFIVAHGRDLMAGVVDLMYESADGWHVRDYKTDLSLEPSAYAGQLEVYRLALQAVKCSVVDAALVHVRADGENSK